MHTDLCRYPKYVVSTVFTNSLETLNVNRKSAICRKALVSSVFSNGHRGIMGYQYKLSVRLAESAHIRRY